MLGAHSDSIASGPDINDNGSGSEALLETALLLAQYKTVARVQFAWWTAEESGLLGTRLWVSTASDEELSRVRLYLNFDMLASPNFKLAIYDGDGKEFGRIGAAGSGHVKQTFEAFFDAERLGHVNKELNGRSDYDTFMWLNIPIGGLYGHERAQN